MTRQGTGAICKHGAVVRGLCRASAAWRCAAVTRRACRASATDTRSQRRTREPGAPSL